MDGASSGFSSTLVGELLVYLKTKYFSVHLGNYEHVASGPAAERTLEWALFALFLGIIVASAASIRYKRLVTRFLSAVKSAEAFSPASARTLDELGLEKYRAIRRLLFRPTPLARLTQALTESGAGENEKAPAAVPALTLSLAVLSSARFFLSAEDCETLLSRYRQKGHPALVLTLTILISIVALALTMRLLPLVLGLVDAIL